MSELLAEAVAQPAGPQDQHRQLAAGAGDLAVLAERGDDGVAFVPVAAAVPGEGLLERAVVGQEAHLQVRLEEPEPGALLHLADAVADRAHQDLLRILVLLALCRRELQSAHATP